jgi:hypothetical protein
MIGTADANVSIALSAQRLEQKSIIDLRTFLPHQIKEIEEWSWRKMKNEKWCVHLDCVTGKFRIWKVTKEESSE